MSGREFLIWANRCNAVSQLMPVIFFFDYVSSEKFRPRKINLGKKRAEQFSVKFLLVASPAYERSTVLATCIRGVIFRDVKER